MTGGLVARAVEPSAGEGREAQGGASARGAYALSRFSAVWRTFALLVFASIAMLLFSLLLLALGVLA